MVTLCAMQGYHQEPQYAQPYAAPGPKLQEGVRQFMNGVYAWMAAGIGVTAAVAWGISQSEEMLTLLFTTPLWYVLMFAPLVMAWVLPSRISGMSRGMAVGVFLIFASVLGAALSPIPIIYTLESIGVILLATIGMFSGMALFGYVTKKDLTGVGQFLLMALLGAVLASIINIFFVQSEGMSMIVSIIVAIAAAGLTAYHTQAVKQLYLVNGGAGNLAILGAPVRRLHQPVPVVAPPLRQPELIIPPAAVEPPTLRASPRTPPASGGHSFWFATGFRSSPQPSSLRRYGLRPGRPPQAGGLLFGSRTLFVPRRSRRASDATGFAQDAPRKWGAFFLVRERSSFLAAAVEPPTLSSLRRPCARR